MAESLVSRPFVPDGFVVPDPPATGDFTFEVLGPQHNEPDLAAWTGSMAHIQATPGFVGRSWPVRVYTADENLQDLQMHADDFVARSGFTWTVLDPATRETIGCLYVYPPKEDQSGVDADVRSWVVADRADLDAVLYRHILRWLRADWPFTRIRYAER